MFLTRYFGRRFLAVAYTRSESTAAAAVASTVQTAKTPVEDEPVGYGWKLSELQTKSWDDLQKLWDVVLEEKNMLTTQRQTLRAQKLEFQEAKRLAKARQSLSQIKLVMTRRGVYEPDKKKSLEMMRIVNAM